MSPRIQQNPRRFQADALEFHEFTPCGLMIRCAEGPLAENVACEILGGTYR